MLARIGGEAGIRTLGTLASTPHFECGPFDHSGTSPYFGRGSTRHSSCPAPRSWRQSRHSLTKEYCDPTGYYLHILILVADDILMTAKLTIQNYHKNSLGV